MKTSSQLWNMGEEARHGLGLLCCHRWKNEFRSLLGQFARKTNDCLSNNWSPKEDGWCNKATAHRVQEIQQQNGFQRRKYTFSSSSESWPPLHCCGMTSRERFIPEKQGILLNQNSSVNSNGPKFILTVVQVWSATPGNGRLRLLLSKEGQPVIKSKDPHIFPPCISAVPCQNSSFPDTVHTFCEKQIKK